MRAILWTHYGSPDLLELQDIPKPKPKDNEVLIKIHAASVSPGDCELRRFDMHVLFWLPLRVYFGIFKPRRVLGMELSGTIEELGKNVSNFNVGDNVFAGTSLQLGAHAEYICLKGNGLIATKPTNLSFEGAATLATAGINALHYIRLAKLQSGQKILINGAGGCFGTYAIQLAKYYGAEVTAVDSTEKLDALRSLGADHIIDFRKEDYTRASKKYDVVFDVVGKGSILKGMKTLKKDGCYILATPWVKQVFQGLWASWTSSRKFVFQLAGEKVEDLVHLKELIEAGHLVPVVDRRFSLEDIVAAHHYVEGGNKIGNVVITVTNENEGHYL